MLRGNTCPKLARRVREPRGALRTTRYANCSAGHDVDDTWTNPDDRNRRIRKIARREQAIVKRALLLSVMAGILVLGASRARAQSVIVSVPSTDVTRPGTLMLAHESQVNLWSYDRPYWNSFTFVTYGVGRNLELAATLYGLSSPGSGNVALAVGYKHRVPLAESPWEPTLAFGQMIPLSLSGTGAGFWTFGVASLRLPVTGTRFTMGPSYGSKQVFGRTTLSALAGVEQPLTPSVSLIFDWFSGGHDLGAAVPALQWNASHSFIVIAGIKLPNTPRAGPVACLVELTYDLDFH